MKPERGLQALLEAIRSWLERAGDDEVLALNRVVREEMTRRMLRHDSMPPQDSDQPADPSTPSSSNF